MSSKKQGPTARQPTVATYLMVAVAAAIAGFVAVYVNYGLTGNGAQSPGVPGSEGASAPAGRPGGTGLAAYVRGAMTTFVPHDEPRDVPTFSFQDGSGAERTIADWKGKVVLLNLWATWCGPCRKEMPSLDRLQGTLGGEDFEVVAVSIDKTNRDKPKAFLDEIAVKNLGLYHDRSAKAGLTLKAFGMPTTLLIGRDGKELGRLVGPAEWDSKDALALLRAVIGKDG
jgi:thiol-disulfide isomerase/thioredoxin